MSTTPSTPADVLASEPECKHGIKTVHNQAGDRQITFRWKLGETTGHMDTPVTLVTALIVSYRSAGQRSQFYANLWREEHDGTYIRTAFDGSNGLSIHVEPAARYSAKRLPTFADQALAKLREMADDPQVLAYFTLPEQS